VWRAIAEGHEAEPSQPIEPLHLGSLKAARRGDDDMRSGRRHLRRMYRRRLVHREDAKSLQALGPLQNLADNARTFIRGLIAVAPQAGHVEKNVRQAVVGDGEPVAL